MKIQVLKNFVSIRSGRLQISNEIQVGSGPIDSSLIDMTFSCSKRIVVNIVLLSSFTLILIVLLHRRSVGFLSTDCRTPQTLSKVNRRFHVPVLPTSHQVVHFFLPVPRDLVVLP